MLEKLSQVKLAPTLGLVPTHPRAFCDDLQEQVTDLQEQLASQQQHNVALQEQLASQGVQLRALQAQVQGALLQRLV